MQQVGAGAVDRARELDLLVVEVAVRVVGQQLAEDQQRVERRAQLVAHVRQELATCSASTARAGRRAPRAPRGPRSISAFLILDVAVLRDEQRRLLLELLVGLAQLLLLGLQLVGGATGLLSSSGWSAELSCWLQLLDAAAPVALVWSSSSSVRPLAMIVESTTPIVSASWSRNVRLTSVNGCSEAELEDGQDLVLEEDRQHDRLTGRASPSPLVTSRSPAARR